MRNGEYAALKPKTAADARPERLHSSGSKRVSSCQASASEQLQTVREVFSQAAEMTNGT